MFWLFKKACKKYHFSYILINNSYRSLTLHLLPPCGLGTIECQKDNYFDLFTTAIKLMKNYKAK